jgi:uncharacterized membrane protein YhaH (DUF805 family)
MSTNSIHSVAGRIRADSHAYVAAVLIVVAITFGAAFVVSAVSQAAIGRLAGLPPVLAWLVAIAIDGATLVSALGIAAKRSRGQSTKSGWGSMIAFALVSVTLNAIHGLSSGRAGDSLIAFVAVLLVSGVMPMSILSVLENALAVSVVPVAAGASAEHLQALARVNDRRAATPSPAIPPSKARRGSAQELDGHAAVRDAWATGQFTTKRALGEKFHISETEVRRALNPVPHS